MHLSTQSKKVLSGTVALMEGNNRKAYKTVFTAPARASHYLWRNGTFGDSLDKEVQGSSLRGIVI